MVNLYRKKSVKVIEKTRSLLSDINSKLAENIEGIRIIQAFNQEKRLQEEFDEIFKSKVLMYIYEDILKHKKIDFFIEGVQTLSDVMNAYDNGKVFNFEIEKRQVEGDNYNLKVAEGQSSYNTKG